MTVDEAASQDPLAELSIDESRSPSSSPLELQAEETTPSYHSHEELVELLSQRQSFDFDREDLDPLEWAFRKVVPIPARYYWDVVDNDHQDDEASQIPRKIQWWHQSIYTLSNAYHWTERRVGLPLAKRLGLLSPRMSDVTMFMTDEDWKKSQRIVNERKQQQEAKKTNANGDEEEVKKESSSLSSSVV